VIVLTIGALLIAASGTGEVKLPIGMHPVANDLPLRLSARRGRGSPPVDAG